MKIRNSLKDQKASCWTVSTIIMKLQKIWREGRIKKFKIDHKVLKKALNNNNKKAIMKRRKDRVVDT